MGAPVHRFHAFVNIALVGHGAKHTDLLRFKGMMQRQIRMLPVAQYAQPFKFFALDINKVMRIGITFSPQIQCGHAVTIDAHIMQTGMFDRHPVSIPAGYIGSIKTFGIFIFDNDIF